MTDLSEAATTGMRNNLVLHLKKGLLIKQQITISEKQLQMCET